MAEEINSEGFYEHLFTFFMREVDMTGFDPHNTPITDAKKIIQGASKSPIEIFVEEHYDIMMKDVTLRELFESYIEISNEQYSTSKNPIVMKERTFRLHILKYIDEVGHAFDKNRNKKPTYRIKPKLLEEL